VQTSPTAPVDDLEAIRQLKARYFRTLDTKDWNGFRELFTADAHIDFAAESGVYDGVDAFLAVVEPRLRDVVTVHHGHMPEITLTSPETATGIWAMEDRLRFPPGHTLRSVHGFGHYHETYRRTADGWRIQSLRLTRLARDVTRAEPETSG
jgi:hypothetical protein